jgi:mannose-6-phosphate isomerase-like protein (cupin superfamily)
MKSIFSPRAIASGQRSKIAPIFSGVKSPPAVSNPTEEFYYVVSGTGLMKIDGEEQQVNQGDTVIILPGMRHKITNNGTAPLLLLACCSPEWTAEDQVLVE